MIMMRLSRTEYLHHRANRRSAHMRMSMGVVASHSASDEDHRSHSRNQAPQSPANSIGHNTVTVAALRRNSVRISAVATTATGLLGNGLILRAQGDRHKRLRVHDQRSQAMFRKHRTRRPLAS